MNEENQKLKREKCKPPLNQLRIQSVDTFLKKLFQSNSVQGHLLRYCFMWTKQGHINHALEFFPLHFYLVVQEPKCLSIDKENASNNKFKSKFIELALH